MCHSRVHNLPPRKIAAPHLALSVSTFFSCSGPFTSYWGFFNFRVLYIVGSMVHFCSMLSFKIELETPVICNCAENWDELTPAQFHQVIALQLSTPAEPTDKEKEIFYIGIMRMFFQVPKKVFFNLPIMESLYAEYNHIALLFLNEPKANKSLLPTLTIDGVEYSGPKSGFTGITLEQMAVIEVLMDSFCDDADEQLLNKMVAAMYYPYAQGEMEIIDSELNKLAENVGALAYSLRFAAYLNYRSLRTAVPDRCHNLFGDGGSESTKTVIEQWEDMFSTLAKDGPQHEADVKSVEAIRAMRWLNNEYEKVKKK